MAEPTVPLTPLAPPRPRRMVRRLRRLGVLTLLFLVLVWFAPAIVARTGLTNRLAGNALADFAGTIQVGSASLGWFSPVELRDVTVTDATGRTLITAPRIVTSQSLFTFIRDRSNLGTITIERPIAEIVCENQTTNIETAVAKYVDGPATGSRPSVSIRVIDGTLTIQDAARSRKRTLTGVEGDVVIPAGAEPITVKLNGETGPGRITADLAIGPEITGKLVASEFPLDAIEPFVRRAEPGLTLAGMLTCDATFGVTLPAGLRLNGQAMVADLDFAVPRLIAEAVKLKQVKLTASVASTRNELRIENVDLTCDLGTASLAGILDMAEPMDKWLDRPGLRAMVDADVSAVAAQFPKLLHIRDGLSVREGRVRLDMASQSGPAGVVWTGSAKASTLKANQAGRTIVWDQPLELSFAGRLGPDRMPTFDRLDCKAEFATLTARGSLAGGTLTGTFSLDRLAARLGEFIDLGGLMLAGTAEVGITLKPNAKGASALEGLVKLNRFVYADGTRELREPNLTLNLAADGRFDGVSSLRLDTAQLALAAGPDRLDVRLLEPVPDLRTIQAGKVNAKLSGDLARWRNRLSPFVAIPADWRVGGSGSIEGTVRIDPERIACEQMAGELTAVAFTGAGLILDEPLVKLFPTAAVIDRRSGRVEVGPLQLASQTAGLASNKLTFTPAATGGYAISGTLLGNLNLARLQRTLRLQSDPKLADLVAGIVRSGSITIDTAGTRHRFKATLPIDGFMYGPPTKPTWSEPKLTLAAEGEYDATADHLQLDAVAVERPVGFNAKAKGTIAKLATVQEIDLDGSIAYDLATLEPQLRAYLGPGAKLAGRDSRAFRIRGPLAGGAQNLSASVSGLTGNAALAWQSVRAYGFDVGRAELKMNLDRGTLRGEPVEAAFGQTGTVRIEPSIRFGPGSTDLVLAKGRVVNRATLTPAACADALGYALPALARTSEAEGLVSLDLDEGLVPLADSSRSTMKGRLTLHAVRVGPGPLVAELATLFGAKQTKISLADEQVVPVRLENGRVFHEGLSLAANGFGVRTSGSVGLDGSLDLTAEVPVPESAVASLLKNNPRIREALAKKRIAVPIWGSIAKPRLDPRAFQDAVRKFAAEVARDAVKGATDDLLRKGQEKLEKELEKKLDKLLPPPKKQEP